MRSADMTAGEAYRLVGSGLKVTVLDTPPELTRQGKVRVRFETGITAGRVKDIASRRVEAPWGRPREPAPLRARRHSPVVAFRAARVGDRVTLEGVRQLIWTVDTLDRDRGEAEVSSVLFDQPITRTEPLDRLQVHVDPPRDSEGPRVRPDRDRAAAAGHAGDAAERLRPVKPRRELDELMDDVLFTRGCLRHFERRVKRTGSGPPLERLREEIRRKGYLMHPDQRQAGEYARVRVPGRFDVVLATRPTPEAPVTVGRLWYPARHPRQRLSGGEGKRRAA